MIDDAVLIKEKCLGQEESLDELIAEQTRILADAETHLGEEKHRKQALRAVELRTSTWSDEKRWICRYCEWIENEDGELEDVVNQIQRMFC